MTENETYKHGDFRGQVLKVVLFNIFINVVENGMHGEADKFVLNPFSYQNAKQ